MWKFVFLKVTRTYAHTIHKNIYWKISYRCVHACVSVCMCVYWPGRCCIWDWKFWIKWVTWPLSCVKLNLMQSHRIQCSCNLSEKSSFIQVLLGSCINCSFCWVFFTFAASNSMWRKVQWWQMLTYLTTDKCIFRKILCWLHCWEITRTLSPRDVNTITHVWMIYNIWCSCR